MTTVQRLKALPTPAERAHWNLRNAAFKEHLSERLRPLVEHMHAGSVRLATGTALRAALASRGRGRRRPDWAERFYRKHGPFKLVCDGRRVTFPNRHAPSAVVKRRAEISPADWRRLVQAEPLKPWQEDLLRHIANEATGYHAEATSKPMHASEKRLRYLLDRLEELPTAEQRTQNGHTET